MIHRYDSNGAPFTHAGIDLSPKEYAKVFHEVNDLYYSKYVGSRLIMHRTVDLDNNYCIYYVEIHGFNDYNIVDKLYD